MGAHSINLAVNPNKVLSRWLFTVCFFIAIMVVFGGYVRLTRSGLSMVEWHVVSGVIPPLGEAAWQETFEKYQQTPEYQKINAGMTLQAYKSIYYREYIHRILGRITGLVFVIPLLFFLLTKTIPLKKSPVYLGIGLLFALQGFMGWYMVSSGLIDQPNVSPYRLTVHLLLALALLALCFWIGLDQAIGVSASKRQSDPSILLPLLAGLIGVIIIQVSYGGLVAGLKAGYISNTFPLIFGYLIPPGLLSAGLEPWPKNLVANAVTVHFLHRWVAFAVLLFSMALYYVVRNRGYSRTIQRSTLAIVVLTTIQILLGLGVIWWQVPVSLAVIHQTVALILFVVAFFLSHRLLSSFRQGGIFLSQNKIELPSSLQKPRNSLSKMKMLKRD